MINRSLKSGYTAIPCERSALYSNVPSSTSLGGGVREIDLKRLADITAPTALFLSVSARFEARSSAERGRDETLASLHDTFSWLWQRMSRVAAIYGGPSEPSSNYSAWLS